MATQSRRSGISEIFGDTQSADNLRRQFIEAPMEAGGQAALGSAAELATLMSVLPGAFAASQRRELRRVTRSAKENDARIAALQTSIEQAEVLHAMALRGQVRVQRALVAIATNQDVFHGFISDTELAPLKGLTVSLTTNSMDARAKALSATTDDDGYFSIALGATSGTKESTGAKPRANNLSQRITDVLTGLGNAPSASPAASVEPDVRQVQIVKREKLLYSEQVLVPTDGGSIYREYALADIESSSASDSRNSVSKRSPGQPTSRADPTESAAEALPARTTVPQAPTIPVRERTTKKGSSHGAKAIKKPRRRQ
jgi:hypothetical protein